MQRLKRNESELEVLSWTHLKSSMKGNKIKMQVMCAVCGLSSNTQAGELHTPALGQGTPSGREKREKEGKRSKTLEPKGPPTVLEMFCALKNILNVQNVNLCGPWVLGT